MLLLDELLSKFVNKVTALLRIFFFVFSLVVNFVIICVDLLDLFSHNHSLCFFELFLNHFDVFFVSLLPLSCNISHFS